MSHIVNRVLGDSPIVPSANIGCHRMPGPSSWHRLHMRSPIVSLWDIVDNHIQLNWWEIAPSMKCRCVRAPQVAWMGHRTWSISSDSFQVPDSKLSLLLLSHKYFRNTGITTCVCYIMRCQSVTVFNSIIREEDFHSQREPAQRLTSDHL